MVAHAPPIVLDFEEGIDRKTLRRLRDRFLVVNRQRWERAHSSLTYRQQAVLEVLPLVFHTNHPALPGYLDADCPYGLSHYQPDTATINAARRLARTFNMRSGGKRRADVESLFLMGSPGTLGHSVTSDLDVWLCHRDDLPLPGIQCLERKAEKLAEWALTFGIELHVFVFSAADWRNGRPRAEVQGENCGSAQHYLLLDEFYRTGIHLGGCYPVWWLVPSEQEAHYRECVTRLTDNRFIRGDEYIDFGAVPAIPAKEFLGAGVWQLYKGIDAPWKAILKLLLIECYAQTQEQPVLSRVFKEAVFHGVTEADVLDPYVMLYQRLEQWLTEAGAGKRLDLVRRSLYLKAGLPLTRAAEQGTALWRARLLRTLVTDWGWQQEQIDALDNRHLWRAEEVSVLRRVVVSELTHSYRLLSKMARAHGEQAAINANDISLLGRKLYATFQRKAGKVEQVNPGLAPTLAEENLAFYQQPEQAGNGWLLYRDLDMHQDLEAAPDTFWQPVIQRSGSLAELVVWCYYNGLLTRSTRLNVRAGESVASISELREMLGALASFVQFPVRSAGREALARRVHPLRNLLLINVGVDPQSHLTERGLHKLSAQHDSLGFSGGRENLVLTIDQVTLNSWHEVSFQHYASGDTLIQCLKNILASVARNPGAIPGIEVYSHNRGHGSAIARRVQELFVDVLRQFFAGGTGPHPLRYVIEMGGRYFLLEFRGNEPGFIVLETQAELMACLAQPQDAYLPIVFDRYALLSNLPLRAACQASAPDCVQVFYVIRDEQAQVWVIDEQGSLFGWNQRMTSRRHFLTPLLAFLKDLLERRALHYSGEPGALAGIRCYELVLDNGIWYPEYRPQREPGSTLPAP